MNKVKFFRELMCKFDKIFKLPKILLWKDNRLGNNYVASVLDGFETKTKQKVQIIRYNEKLLKKMARPDIIHAVLHEIGHVKTKGYNKVRQEYQAEKFALRKIQKYYPRHYKRAIAYIKHAQHFTNRIYAKAFGKLLKEIT